jgi:predicted homoserine dehydrogenase-like protein
MEDDPVIVQMLIDYGASMTVKSVSSGKKANTPLFLSATTGKKQAAEVLLKKESIRMIC